MLLPMTHLSLHIAFLKISPLNYYRVFSGDVARMHGLHEKSVHSECTLWETGGGLRDSGRRERMMKNPGHKTDFLKSDLVLPEKIGIVSRVFPWEPALLLLAALGISKRSVC